jgi:hypothetical protein
MNFKPEKSKTVFLLAKANKDENGNISVMPKNLTLINGNGEVLEDEIFSGDEENGITPAKKLLNAVLENCDCIITYAEDDLKRIKSLLSKKNAEKFKLNELPVRPQNKFGNHANDDFDDDDESDEQKSKSLCLSCQKNFSMLVGEFNKKGACKRQSLKSALEYYGISAEGELDSNVSETIAIKNVWETMYPDFYGIACEESSADEKG